MLNTPVLFLVFNRLDTTKQVFARIREVKPKQLFIAADGPREGRKGEKEIVESVRNFILENIDWDCEVKTLFREKNLGCGIAPAEAITWFFEHVEQGIILEDDCLPEVSFFFFCEKMLEIYKHEESIFSISATNHLLGEFKSNNHYFFSNFNSIWGWATWRRCWIQYKYKIDYNEILFDDKISKKIKNNQIKAWLKNMVDAIINNKIDDAWDIQWQYLFFVQDALSIVPYRNQVKNIGYQGTHTMAVREKHIFFEMPTYSIDVNSLKILETIEVDEIAEAIWYKNIIKYELKEGNKLNLKSQLSKLLPKMLKDMLKKKFRIK